VLKTTIIKKKDIKKLKIKKGVVVCGDIHIFNVYPYNDNSNIISSRLSDIASALDEVGYVAKVLDLPIVLNGDIITSGIFDYPVEYVLTKFLTKYSDTTIFINLGNHDFDGIHSVITPLIKYGNNNNHFVMSEPSKFSFYEVKPKVNFYFAPFQRKIEALRSLEKLSKKLNGKEINILFIHNQFSGSIYSNKAKSKSGISQNLFVNGKFSKYNMVIASHIHKFQSICGGKGIYTSSLIPLNFGERRKEHGFHIIDIENKYDYFIIPKAPKFVYLNLDQLKEYDKSHLAKKIKGNIICIKKKNETIINKKNITKKLLLLGARFVTFKNIVKNKRKENEMKIKESENVEEIVSKYSKVLFDRNPKMKHKKIENIGLEILHEAQQVKSLSNL